MTYYNAGTFDIAVIGAGHPGPHRRWGGAVSAVQAFSPVAKTLAQGQFTCPEHVRFPWGGATTGSGTQK